MDTVTITITRGAAVELLDLLDALERAVSQGARVIDMQDLAAWGLTTEAFGEIDNATRSALA